MKKLVCCWFALFLLTVTWPACAGELESLFAAVHALNIECQGYVLGQPLTPAQQAAARENIEKADSEKVYKFRDRDLNIVVDRETHRVLVIFERFEQIDRIRVRKLVGDLFIRYGDPTVSAHDKVIYWAWGRKGKFSAKQFDQAKQENKALPILATVKLNSDIKIREDTRVESKGDSYYIISSDPLLKWFQVQ